MLERNRIPLLRHDAARLHEAVAEPHVAELERPPEQQILYEAAEAGQQHRRRRHALEQVVHRRNRAVCIASRAVEAEQIACQVAVDRKAGAGDGTGPKRVSVGREQRRLQADGIALELLDDGKQIVRHGRGLRGLRMCVHRHHGVAMLLGDVEQAVPQRQHTLMKCQDELPLPHPVHRHVDVVAAPRGVQAPGDIVAARGDEQSLHVEKQVLVAAVVGDLPDLVHVDAVEGQPELVGVCRPDDRPVRQHHQVRVVNRHQRRDKQPLGVLEVLVENVLDVFRREPHGVASITTLGDSLTNVPSRTFVHGVRGFFTVFVTGFVVRVRGSGARFGCEVRVRGSGARFGVRGSKFGVRGSRFEVRGARCEVRMRVRFVT